MSNLEQRLTITIVWVIVITTQSDIIIRCFVKNSFTSPLSLVSLRSINFANCPDSAIDSLHDINNIIVSDIAKGTMLKSTKNTPLIP